MYKNKQGRNKILLTNYISSEEIKQWNQQWVDRKPKLRENQAIPIGEKTWVGCGGIYPVLPESGFLWTKHKYPGASTAQLEDFIV